MRALLPLLSVLLASVASGQAPLSGTLSAPDGTPYADVEVRLESGRLDIPDSTRTDAEGRFAFERAVAGAIVVSTGGEPLWLPLAIPDGASGPFTLDLVVPRVRGEGADYLAGFRASGTRPLAEVLSVYVAAEAGHRTPATSPELEAATEEMQARVSEAPLDRKNAVRDSLRALVGPLYEAALQPRIDAYDAALPAGALEGTATAHAFWRLYRITPDSLTALRVLETVPTDAPLWSFQGLSRSGVNNTLFLLARALVPDGGPVPAPLDAYFRALAYGYPDPNVRAQASGVLVGVLRSAGDDQRAAVGVDRLYREHPDSYQAERLRRGEAEDRRVQAGRQLPDFAIPSLADSTVMITRADLSGKTVLVDFWGTWCSPCIAELPQLHDLHEQYADEGFDILSIATFDTRGAIATFREDRGFPMPWRHALLPDDQMEWARDRFEFTGIPAYLLVAPDGSILAEGWDARGIGLVTALETWFGDE